MSPNAANSGCLMRLLWFMFGPMVLLVLTLLIVEKGGGWTSPASLAFLLVLTVTIVARWLDFRGGDARTADGELATAAHVQRYTGIVVIVGLAVWVVANLLGSR